MMPRASCHAAGHMTSHRHEARSTPVVYLTLTCEYNCTGHVIMPRLGSCDHLFLQPNY